MVHDTVFTNTMRYVRDLVNTVINLLVQKQAGNLFTG
jgi:hypothetical protein